MTRSLPREAVSPTQLYISSAKLTAVTEWFDFDTPAYDPLPVFEHNERWYLADGHTRALAAYLAGAETLTVRQEAIRKQYDFDVYVACIDWCNQAGITAVSDLAGRVVEPATFQTRWIDRCKQVGD